MVYITEFTVDGLAGRKETYSQKLNKDINVFFGFNGSGKTSLLKILNSALTLDSSLLNHVPFQSAEVKLYSVAYKKIFTYSIAPTKGSSGRQPRISSKTVEMEPDSDTSETVLPPWKQSAEKTAKEKISRWKHRYLPTSRLWDEAFTRVDRLLPTAPVSEWVLDEHFERALKFLWSGYIGRILGDVRQAQEEGLGNILSGIISLNPSKSKGEVLDVERAYLRAKSFLTRQGAQSALSSLSDFKKQYSKNRTLKNVIGYIDDVENQIEKAMAPRDKLQSLITKMFKGKTVEFKDSAIKVMLGDKTDIKLASLSSGEKQVLKILIECLYSESGVFLIDEPEISMHVDWQKDLISAMRAMSPDAQLILATHSPEIMAEIEDEKIFRI